MKKNLLIAVLLVFVLKMQAQLENIPLVTVTGEAVHKVIPDEIILKVTISKPFTISQLKSLKVFNVFDSEDIQIKFIGSDANDISESLVIIEDKKEVKLVKEVYIIIEDVTKYTSVLLKLYNLGFDNISIIDIRSTKLKEHKLEAYIDAVENAREKANLLASSLSQSIGVAHTIEDIEQPIINWYNDYIEVPYKDDIKTVDEYNIFPGLISISVKVRVSFELNK